MKIVVKYCVLIMIAVLAICCTGERIFQSNGHPSLLLTRAGVMEIRSALGANEAFDASLEKIRQSADAALAQPIEVPVPRDGGGGYTHEKHKDNYYAMFNCGVLYQITREEKYAAYVRDMLLAYCHLYPTLGRHPVVLSPVPGQLFWQTLNESVWLVHTSVAYDCIHEFLTEDERATIENQLLRKVAGFLMEGNPANVKTFNKMHNHGTWSTAAVGMAGYAMSDTTIVKKALYGSDMTGQNGGFVKQLDELFSPDGYFTEGAYYQRYALWPFVIFSQAIQNNQPELKIFEYRDHIISKALNALLQLAYDGRFFTFNDAMPKGYDAQELIYAVDIIYKSDPSQKQLLDVAARYQDGFLPTDAGYSVARDIAAGEAMPLDMKSMLLRDGADGTQGGVGILREQNSALFFKATSHGLSHGHYDKLMMAFFDNGHPVLTDYGAARFVNIEAKYKGHYTPQNKTFAMSTVAHNTVVVDEKSHFGGDYDLSSQHFSSIYLFDASRKDVQVVSAKEDAAAPGVKMHRTLAYVDVGAENKVIFDIFRLTSDKTHTYDYPLWYNGQMISLNFPYKRNLENMTVLGKANGYQHLWVEASGTNDKPFNCFTWLTGDRFYSACTIADSNTETVMARSGANDPDFNLRSETCYMLRHKGSANHTFFSVIEPHGKYDLVVEQTSNAVSSVSDMKIVADTPDYTSVSVTFVNGSNATFIVCNTNSDATAKHSFSGKQWTGAYYFETN